MNETKEMAKRVYRFFSLPEEKRTGNFKELFTLCDSHRWQEADLMLDRLSNG